MMDLLAQWKKKRAHEELIDCFDRKLRPLLAKFKIVEPPNYALFSIEFKNKTLTNFYEVDAHCRQRFNHLFFAGCVLSGSTLSLHFTYPIPAKAIQEITDYVESL